MKVWSNTIDETGTSMVMRDCVEFLIRQGVYHQTVNKIEIAKQLFSECKNQQQIMHKINLLMGEK
jgi:hypothetical protein